MYNNSSKIKFFLLLFCHEIFTTLNSDKSAIQNMTIQRGQYAD